MIQKEIFTIGYSTFQIDNFVKILTDYKIDCVIDVRSNPVSAYHSDFDKIVLSNRLKRDNIMYRNYKDEFGARQTDIKYFTEGYLDFQKFIKSEQFLSGADKIKKGMNLGYKFVLMCAEKRPETCHRTIMIAKYFYDNGYDVKHIIEDGHYKLQTDIENILLNNYFPNRNQLSLFDEEIPMEEMIRKSYILQNKEIGYRLDGTVEDYN